MIPARVIFSTGDGLQRLQVGGPHHGGRMRGIDSVLRAAHACCVPYTYVVQRVIAAPVGCLRRRPAPFPDQTHASHKAVVMVPRLVLVLTGCRPAPSTRAYAM